MARQLVKTLTDQRDNIIINGNFLYAQRNNGTVNIGASHSYISVDRWTLAYSGTWTLPQSFLSSTSLPPGSSSTRSLVVQGTPSAKNSATNLQIRQKIEDIMARKIPIGQKATLSFWYVSDTNGGLDAEITVNIEYANSLNNFSAVTSIISEVFNPVAVGSWQRKTITFTMPSGAHNGLQILITWGNVNTGANRQFFINDIMLHEGEDALDTFVLAGKNAAGELQLCQRYFEKSYDLETPLNTVTGTGEEFYIAESNAEADRTFYFRVTKRTTSPLVASYNMLNLTSFVPAVSERGFKLNTATSAGHQNVYFQWSADAEL